MGALLADASSVDVVAFLRLWRSTDILNADIGQRQWSSVIRSLLARINDGSISDKKAIEIANFLLADVCRARCSCVNARASLA